MTQHKYLLLFLFLFGGCSTDVEPIEYGHDACHFCEMTIVDKQHAAEAVTTKGKVRKFDAIECLLRFKRKNADLLFKHMVVNTFDSPGQLVDAETCVYLISPELPSPMGASLTAFDQSDVAQEVLKKKGGELYSWSEIVSKEDL